MENNQVSSELAQLATALSGIAPTLRTIGTQNLEAEKARLTELAKATALRYKNMEDFRAAVENKQIPEQDTPYFVEFLHREVARNDVASQAAALRDQYLRGEATAADGTPLIKSDDPVAVSDYVRQTLSQRYADSPPSVQAIVSDDIGNEAQRLANYHVTQRSEARQVEAYAAISNNIRDALIYDDGLMDSGLVPGAPFVLSQSSLNGIQQKINENGVFLESARLNAAVAGAVMDYGVNTGNLDKAEEVLKRLKVTVGGEQKSLRDTPEADDLIRKAKSAVMERELQAIRYNDAMQKEDAEQLVNAALDRVGKLPSGSGLNTPQVMEVLGQIPGHLRFKIEQEISGSAQRWRTATENSQNDHFDELTKKFVGEVTSGRMTRERYAQYMNATASINKAGAAKELLALWNGHSDLTDNEAYINLRQAASTGDLTIDQVMGAAQANLISSRHVDELTGLVLDSRGGGLGGSSQDADLLKAWIGRASGVAGLPGGDAELNATVAVALRKYQDGMVQWNKDNPKADGTARRQQAHALLRAVAEQYTGVPIDKIEQEMLAPPEVALPGTAPKPSPEQQLAAALESGATGPETNGLVRQVQARQGKTYFFNDSQTAVVPAEKLARTMEQFSRLTMQPVPRTSGDARRLRDRIIRLENEGDLNGAKQLLLDAGRTRVEKSQAQTSEFAEGPQQAMYTVYTEPPVLLVDFSDQKAAMEELKALAKATGMTAEEAVRFRDSQLKAAEEYALRQTQGSDKPLAQPRKQRGQLESILSR